MGKSSSGRRNRQELRTMENVLSAVRGSTRGGGFAHSAEKLRYTFLHGRFRKLVHTIWIRYNLNWRKSQ